MLFHCYFILDRYVPIACKFLLNSTVSRLSDQTWVESLCPWPGAPTHRFSWRLVESVILEFSTELINRASMRPKVNAIGLPMVWGTHDSIFKVFGKIGILGWKCLLRPNGTFWGDSDGTIVISRSKTPFEEKMRKTFADRHTYRHTDTEIIPGKPVWHNWNFFIKKLSNILKMIELNIKYVKNM